MSLLRKQTTGGQSERVPYRTFSLELSSELGTRVLISNVLTIHFYKGSNKKRAKDTVCRV